MKILLASLLFSAIFLISSKTGDVLPIGNEIPKAELLMKDISGKDISLKKAASSKGLLVMFSSNTCPYVIKNQQRTLDICQYAKDKKLGVIILNSNEAYRNGDDSFGEMKKYADEQKYNWYYAEDKNHIIADAFGANRTPECFLFDKKLKLVYHGAIDDNPSNATSVKRNHLKEAINEMMAGKDISTKETRSIGCTIKRNLD